MCPVAKSDTSRARIRRTSDTAQCGRSLHEAGRSCKVEQNKPRNEHQMRAGGEMTNLAVSVIRLLKMSNSTTSDVPTISHTASNIMRRAILISTFCYEVESICLMGKMPGLIC